MRLKCLGSGSSGNCYILENETEALVIEAGLPFKEVKRALGFNVKKIKAVIISHIHGDHRKYWHEYVMAGIPVFEPYKNEGCIFQISKDSFWIKAFELVHDVPCYGFFIKHPEIGKMIYASDTEYIKYRFKNLDHILVECNHDKNFIQADAVNRSHILEGHMELQTTKEFVRVNNNPDLRNVVLLHLSANNSNEEDFKRKIEEVVEQSTNVYVAKKGLKVDLRLVPF